MTQKKEGKLVLPTGKHILEFENVNKFSITEKNEKVEIKKI